MISRYIDINDKFIADLGCNLSITIYDNAEYYLVFDLSRIDCHDEIKFIPAKLICVNSDIVKFSILNYIILKKLLPSELYKYAIE